jgi:uncharacterized membrane protein
MRRLSFVGFVVMVVIAIAAFALSDQWWLRVVLVVVAHGVGWYYLGLYARASTGSAHRLIRSSRSRREPRALFSCGVFWLNQAVRDPPRRCKVRGQP